jgi:DNA polymerase delta subunit 3
VVQDDTQNEDVDGDVEMEDEEVPKPKPRQRKPKKTVPVGRNGLKKKRVIRSRTAADEKGYMGIVVIIVGK